MKYKLAILVFVSATALTAIARAVDPAGGQESTPSRPLDTSPRYGTSIAPREAKPKPEPFILNLKAPAPITTAPAGATKAPAGEHKKDSRSIKKLRPNGSLHVLKQVPPPTPPPPLVI